VTVSARRVLGFVAMAAVFAPLEYLIIWEIPWLLLPDLVGPVVGGVAVLAALKLAYLIRARVDPSFDPSFGAHRSVFDRWPLRPRS
jgi:hypothetical protein